MERLDVQMPPAATYWETVAQSRWGRYVSHLERAAILEAHRLAARPTVALEVGCDGGRWSKVLADRGWQLVCTDTDPQTLRICQERLPAARCVLVRPEDTRLPCDDASIGLMLCIEVDRVIRTDWLRDEARRVLQPGGLLVGVIQNRASWRGLLQRLQAAASDRGDWYGQSYRAWRARYRASGFTFLREQGCYWFPFRRSSNSALVPAAARAEQILGLRRLPSISPWIIFIAQKR